jgi:hypothetical protein
VLIYRNKILNTYTVYDNAGTVGVTWNHGYLLKCWLCCNCGFVRRSFTIN